MKIPNKNRGITKQETNLIKFKETILHEKNRAYRRKADQETEDKLQIASTGVSHFIEG